MARLSRVVVPGLPHHITQRGNNRRDVFLCGEDRKVYLSLIQKYCERYGVSILSYCLMTNHVHFIAIPGDGHSFAHTFRTCHMEYAMMFNKRQNQTGHLWNSRFYSCVLDAQHLLMAARYVERNPVRAGIVEKPWEWKWSSAAFHTAQGPSELSVGDLFDYTGKASELWMDFISDSENQDFSCLIRENTRTGRPVGPDSFINEMEAMTGRRIRQKQGGRPKKNRSTVPGFSRVVL